MNFKLRRRVVKTAMTNSKWTLLGLRKHQLQMLSLLLFYYLRSMFHCLVLKSLISALSWWSWCFWTLLREDIIVLRHYWNVIILRWHKRNRLIVINLCLTCILVAHGFVPRIAKDGRFTLVVFHICWTMRAFSLLNGHCRWKNMTLGVNYIIEPFSISNTLLFNILQNIIVQILSPSKLNASQSCIDMGKSHITLWPFLIKSCIQFGLWECLEWCLFFKY